METVEIKVFTFEELSDDAKQKAIEDTQNSEGYLDYEWYDGVFEDATTIAALMGIDIDKIYFSGFWSQGDGACFEGEYRYKKGSVKAVKEYAPADTELHRIVTELYELQRKNFFQLTANVTHYGNYYHERSNRISIDTLNSDRYISDDTDEALTELLRDYMLWIYKKLETDHDYLMSDESVKEYLIANGYEFTADGERF